MDRHLWLVGLTIAALVTARTLTTNVAPAGFGPARVVAPFQSLIYLLGGLTACLLSYRAVVGERETGRLKLLLGFSASRIDLSLGKYVGRTTALVVAFVVPAVFGSLVGFLLETGFTPLRLLLFTAVATLYLAAITGIGIGVSQVVSTSVRSAGVTFGTYIGFFLFWESLVGTAVTSIGGTPDSPLFFALLRLSPLKAFQVLTNLAVGAGNSAGPYHSVYLVTAEGMQTNLHVVATTLDTVPVYLQGWVSVLSLLGWAVVPPAVGYLLFRFEDL